MNRDLETKLARLQIQPAFECFHPVSENELRRIEAHKTCTIPEPLRTFLKVFGLSEFRDCSMVRIRDDRWESLGFPPFADLSLFYGAAERGPNDSYSLLWNIENFEWRMPNAVIPFARAEVDKYAMGLRGEDEGKVFYYLRDDLDLEEEEKGPLHERITDYENMFWVADSFEEFLDQIKLIPWE